MQRYKNISINKMVNAKMTFENPNSESNQKVKVNEIKKTK